MAKSLLQRLQDGERINREEVIQELHKLDDPKPDVRPTRDELIRHHLEELTMGIVYPSPGVELIVWRPKDKTLFHMYGEVERNGVWLVAEKRGGGKRQRNGVSEQASKERHAAADLAIDDLLTYLLSVK